ncbi:MAG: glycosyltransferase [Bdellovibrionales bacterium]|nr:glycosyltransferase [Bdellovibrionales bacterium]
MSIQISIILPTYNRLATLPRALGSILNQTYQNWELIVVDDGSTDGSREWLLDQSIFTRSCGSRARYLPVPHGGVSRARNLGIKQAQGEWIAFLDSDDEWLPDKLDWQMKFMKESNPQSLIIHGEELWIRNGKRVNPCRHHQKSGGNIFRHCIPRCVISPSTVLIHNRIFQTHGLFREDFPVCEDYELWLRLAALFVVGYIPRPLIIKYGGHEDQLSKKFKAMDYWRIKALLPFLNHHSVSFEDKKLCAEIICAKSEILLKGYEKHSNWNHFSEVEEILASSHNFLEAINNLRSTPHLHPSS